MKFLAEIEQMSKTIGWSPEELKALAEIFKSIQEGRSKVSHVKQYFTDNPKVFSDIFLKKSIPQVIRMIRRTKKGEDTALKSYLG